MHSEMEMYRVVIHRGGSSKGIFIKTNELPVDPVKRDKVVRAIFGSPDVRQIDGLAGADVLTSKLAIIGPSTRPDCDVDYTFAQVSYDSEMVDFGGNCGNISAAVGPFAIDEGMVKVTEPITKVRIHQTNTKSVIVAEVPVVNGKAAVEGDCVVDGVPGTGAQILLDMSDSAGGTTGALLPTGNARDVLDVKGYGKFEVSIVDAANVLVFIEAKSLGMVGTETPAEIEGNKELMKKIEAIRGTAAVAAGMFKTPEEATAKPYVPFFAIVSKPADYTTFDTKKLIKASDCDMVIRLLFMLHMHKAYPGTGTACTGAAARIPGSIVFDALSEEAKKREQLRIGHPAGTIVVASAADVGKDGSFKLLKAAYDRTARRIMEGYVYVRKDRL